MLPPNADSYKIILKKKYLFERMQTSQDLKSITHWTKRQDIQYHFYVILKYPWIIQEDSRQSSIFKDMHRFIPTRTPAQCRSHHQKRIRGHPHLSSALAFFFREHYTERLLDVDHLRMELRHFIQQTDQGGKITGEERDELLDAIDVNLTVLDFNRESSSEKGVEGKGEKLQDNKQEKGDSNKIQGRVRQKTIREQKDNPPILEPRSNLKPKYERLTFNSSNIKDSSKSSLMDRAVYDEDNDCFWLP